MAGLHVRISTRKDGTDIMSVKVYWLLVSYSSCIVSNPITGHRMRWVSELRSGEAT